MTKDICYGINWYSKKTMCLLGVEKIENCNLSNIKSIFRHRNQDIPYEVGRTYKISQRHVSGLQKFIKHPISLQKYSYSFGAFLKTPDLEVERANRFLSWHCKKTGEMIDEEVIGFDLKVFKALFHHMDEKDPEMLYFGKCYDIEEEHVSTLQQYAHHVIDLEKYNYAFCTYTSYKMQADEKVYRTLAWFTKKRRRLAGEEEIENFDLDIFKVIFNHTDVVEGCVITEEHLPLLQKQVTHKVNLKKYIYNFCIYRGKIGQTLFEYYQNQQKET